MTGIFYSFIRRDLRLGFSRGSEAAVSFFFFFAVISLFPFAFGGEAAMLQKAAPGIIWIAAMLSAFLSLEGVYHRDYDDGTFDLLLVEGASPFFIVTAKMLSHWILSGFLLLPAAVIAAVMLSLPFDAAMVLAFSVSLGSIYMSFLGGFGAVLTFGSRKPGLLLALLALPLFVPMLVLGMAAVESMLAGLPFRVYLLLQISLVIAVLPLAPLAAASFLKMSLRS